MSSIIPLTIAQGDSAVREFQAFSGNEDFSLNGWTVSALVKASASTADDDISAVALDASVVSAEDGIVAVAFAGDALASAGTFWYRVTATSNADDEPVTLAKGPLYVPAQ